LTALHAVHVLGGFVPLVWITRATLSGAPPDVEGVRLLAIYWHFLFGVWLVMLGLLHV
jgi:cytochrome c oxidase subunit 3